MAEGIGSFKARKSSALKLPMPLGVSRRTLYLTVLEDETRTATIGQVAGM
jgi:hypothetical protein